MAMRYEINIILSPYQHTCCLFENAYRTYTRTTFSLSLKVPGLPGNLMPSMLIFWQINKNSIAFVSCTDLIVH